MTSGLVIAAEPIAIDRDANGRHGAVSVSSLLGVVSGRSASCCATSPISLSAFRHFPRTGGLRAWTRNRSFDKKDLTHIATQSERAAEPPFAISGRPLCSAPSVSSGLLSFPSAGAASVVGGAVRGVM